MWHANPNPTISDMISPILQDTAISQSTPSEDQSVFEPQNLLQSLLENIPDFIYFKDKQSRYVKCSKAMALRVGLQTPQQMIGKTDFDFFTEQTASDAFKDEQEIIATGKPLVNKIEKKTDFEGKITWTSTTKIPLRDSAGNIVGIAGVNRDISSDISKQEQLQQNQNQLEHQIAERTADIRHERRLLSTIVNNLPDAIYAKDVQGRKTLANPADLKNLRCKTEADAMGKTDYDFFPREIAERFVADDMKVIKTGTPVLNREEYFFAEDNTRHWLLSSKLPLHDEHGNIIGLIGIGHDITSQKQTEAQLENIHKELIAASRQAGMADVAIGVLHNVGNVLNSVNVSIDILTEKLRKSRVTGVVKLAKLFKEHTNDIGTYLTEDTHGRQIPSYLEQIAGYLDSERNEMTSELDCLSSNIEHIKQIVTTQQNYARVSGVLEEVYLPDLLEDALKIHGAAYMRHGVTVIKDYSATPKIRTDKHRIMQVIVNLLSNAKYACDSLIDTEKKVTLHLKEIGNGHIQIQVEDNGKGISSENLTRIFSQGFTTRQGGHGFGLHSGALAARDMGGALTVHSDGPGQGAIFTLDIPILSPLPEYQN